MKRPTDETATPFLARFAIMEVRTSVPSPHRYAHADDMQLLPDGTLEIDTAGWHATGTVKTAQDQDPTRDEPGDRA